MKPLSALLCLTLTLQCGGSFADFKGVDGGAARAHTEKIVSFGPRPPGSDAQRKVGDYLIEQLESCGLDVKTHSFEPYTPNGPLPMRNIWGELKGKDSEVIILASHYDSKYFRDIEFVGANDGGSSSGLLLELARILALDNPAGHTLWFVFFDGEEAIHSWTSADSLYGSREFVAMLQRSGRTGEVKALILLDLIGGKNLSLRRDRYSTPWLNEIIWKKAAELGHQDVFLPIGQASAIDDHIPFAEVGIPVVDLIDLGYPYWHQAADTLDKVSAESLEIVGNVVLTSLPEISRRLQ